MIISLYYFTNYLLILAMLMLLYMPNSPKVVVTAGTIAIGTAFNNILLT